MKRIAGLLEIITKKSQPFLDQCSQTRMLAISDIHSAEEKYMTLAEQALIIPNSVDNQAEDCQEYIQAARSELVSNGISSAHIDALRGLKEFFLDTVLKPAVGQYLKGNSIDGTRIEDLYENAMKYEGLLEAAQFINRLGTS